MENNDKDMALYTAPNHCPVCGHLMHITKMSCPHCECELTGKFAPCRFCRLSEKDFQFIETFLRCRGLIKDVEKELGVSYPTVRGMLDNALKELGFDQSRAEKASDDQQDLQCALAETEKKTTRARKTK